MKRAIGLTILVGCVGIGFLQESGVVLGRSRTQQTPPQVERVDRTNPALNKMTPAQRERAKVHAKHRGLYKTRMLDEKLSVSRTSDFGPSQPEPFVKVLRSLVCDADTIFTGFVASGKSYPTENGELLFTDYQVTVSDVFRKKGPLSSQDDVIVTQIGGEIDVEGTRVTAELAAYPPPNIGSEYVFFAQYIPQAPSYNIARYGAAWVISAGRAKSLVQLNVSDKDLIGAGIDISQLASQVRAVECKQ